MINNIVGAAIAIKLLNGKIKIKKRGILTYIVLAIVFFIEILALLWIYISIVSFNIVNTIVSLLGFLSLGYILLISPYLQNPKNFEIKVLKENSFEGLELYYKGEKVDVKFDVDEEGKFKWADNLKKLSCIKSVGNKQVSNFTKYKIINYFNKWLLENDLLSKDVTVSFEKL